MTIRLLEPRDIELLAPLFADIGWNHRVSRLKRYLKEQDRGERVVLVAYIGEDFAGYVTVKWKSDYPPFVEKRIPEIMDLNVVPTRRRRGIASALMDEAERQAFEQSRTIGIGVGMYPDYGAAQRMYILRGYVPDARGLFYKGQHVSPGQEVCVDDGLELMLTKEREQT